MSTTHLRILDKVHTVTSEWNIGYEEPVGDNYIGAGAWAEVAKIWFDGEFIWDINEPRTESVRIPIRGR